MVAFVKVFFCWSTIDATFNTKYEELYEELIDASLVGKWSAGRKRLKDTRFGMNNKMSAILFLTTGRSLFREPDDLWSSLAQSDAKRNSIIHKGETSQEADAELALDVARKVMELMSSLKTKNSKR